ncbi:nanos homolog 1 [Pristis pectinata]|uniref:nanos homolog 1 n=1 Tax=Pristis pectinata TaxID=685728 RepID=UPI00223D6F12|nr:nanos homolog 1 [Pristis pectinata]
MDFLNTSYLRPGGGYDCTFNFWNDYLGLSTLVTKNRRKGPGSPNSITESLKATLGLSDPYCPCLGNGNGALDCYCSPSPRRGFLDLEENFPLFNPFQPLPPVRGQLEAEMLLDPFCSLDLLGADRRVSRKPGSRAKQEPRICVFCRNNGAPEDVYGSHVLKTSDGRVVCPILRAYTCPLCNANGDNAHTIKYCPLSKDQPQQRVLKGGRAVGGGKRVKVF